jgi:hypothetical protein
MCHHPAVKSAAHCSNVITLTYGGLHHCFNKKSKGNQR